MTSVNHSNNLCLVTLPSPSSSADSAELHSKLAALKEVNELCEFYENLKNAKDEPKKLLDNLCDGLETFLGFNSASKGYDGSGIVYSDLDRLCDAVMGFLSGVLEAVKNENEVTTYDKNTTMIGDVINTLQSSIGSGRAGLAESVTQVKGWLEGYASHLKVKTENVTNPLNTLNRQIEESISAYNNSANLDVGLQRDWLSKMATMYISNADHAKKAVASLDQKLVNKLENHVNVLTQATDNFKMLAENDDVQKILEGVNNQIGELTTHARKEIHDKATLTVHEFMDELKSNIRLLSGSVKTVESNITGAHKQLMCLIAEAESVYALTKTAKQKAANLVQYRNRIDDEVLKIHDKETILCSVSSAVSNIQKGVASFNKKMKIICTEMGENDDQSIRGIVSKINANLTIIKRKIQNDIIKRLIEWFNSNHENGLKATENKITRAITDVGEHYEKINAALKTIKTIVQDTDDSRNGRTQLENLVKDVTHKVQSMQTAVETDLRGLRDKIIAKVEEYYDGLGRVEWEQASGTGGRWASLQIDKLNLPDKSFKSWITAASTKGLKSVKNIAGALYETSPTHLPLKALLRSLEGLKENLEFSGTTTTGFGAMQKDAVKDITDAYGEKGKDLNKSTNSSFTTAFDLSKRTIEESMRKFNQQPFDGMKSACESATAADQIVNNNVSILRQNIGELKTGVDYVIQIVDQAKVSATEVQSFIDVAVGHFRKMLNTNLEITFQTIANNATKIHDEYDNNIKTPFIDFINNAKEPLDQIKTLCHNLTSKTTGILKIEDDLKALKGNLSTVEGHLQAMKDARITEKMTLVQRQFHTAKSESTEAIRRIATELEAKISQISVAITQTSRVKYHASKKKELAALQTFVDNTVQKIHDIIDDDSITGVKGFLRKTRFEFVGQMEAFKPEEAGKKFEDFAKLIRDQFNCLVQELYRQRDFKKVHSRIESPRQFFDHLLTGLRDSQHFDHTFQTNLNNLQNALDNFAPSSFSDSPSPLLAPLKSGLAKFTEQLGHAYVNRYSGQKYSALTERKEVPNPEKPDSKETIEITVLTPEGRNCAKVCLTIVEMVSEELWTLLKVCFFNKDMQINTYKHDLFGKWFEERGYSVTSTEGKQTGELQDKDSTRGAKINANLLSKNIESAAKNKHLTTWKAKSINKLTFSNRNAKQITLLDTILFLRFALNDYYGVCHYNIRPNPKAPSSVKDMLQWLAGLRHNSIFEPLRRHFKELFPKRKEDANKAYKDISANDLSLPANTASTTIKPNDMVGSVLVNVCGYSYDTLVAILGHGHEEGRYACEFKTNTDNFDYPSSAAACFDMFADMLYRVYDQLYFLLVQCQRTSENNSWRDCWYGRYVGGSSWSCNEKQCANQNCPQIADQNAGQRANQSADQKCDQHPSCGLKSPLQSFLEDGLQGFLPHSLTKLGCGVECSLGKHRGIPCKTPMGFTGISDTASHTQKGDRILKVLQGFCGDTETPLTKMCSYLSCLLQRPPQTLGDMFGFYFCLINGWGKNAPLHKSEAFGNAVTNAIFGDTSTKLDISPMFKNADHTSGEHSTHAKGDLYCLYSCDYTGQPDITCGRYMRPIGLNTWHVFSSKNGSKYLSWIVYLTETFYTYLENLYNECCEKCNKKGTRCQDTRCVKDCHVKSYYEAQEAATESAKTAKQAPASTQQHHEKLCKTIARCPFSRPTLYKYGFVLNSLNNLSGAENVETKRTCGDLCKTLERVLNKKESAKAPLATLIYRTIPNFLWEIRKPFSYLIVALWLLSLLYLFHIMVIRLDLLHIKSHLHSPSSHRIAAQSLLAAGRVNKVNRVFYLQP